MNELIDLLAEGFLILATGLAVWTLTKSYYLQRLREELNDHQLTKDQLRVEVARFENFKKAYGAVRSKL